MNNLPKEEDINKCLNRAEDMIKRAKKVDAGQYTHEINRTITTLSYLIKYEIHSYEELDRISEYTFKLGGYIYSLQEGI